MLPPEARATSFASRRFRNFLLPAESHLNFTRFLAGLNDKRWKQLQGEGVRFLELSPDLQELLRAALVANGRTVDLAGLVLTREPPPLPHRDWEFRIRNKDPEHKIAWNYTISYAPAALRMMVWGRPPETRP